MVITVLIRVKFAKLSPVRYISHLELMNTLRRAFRRAEIPMAFSKGFNPHPIFAVGQPLSVGMTGRGEYFDLELVERVEPENFVNMINEILPSGLQVLEAREVPEGVKSLMAVANTAIYMITMDFKGGASYKADEVEDRFLGAQKIELIRHRRKKKDRLIDLRPMIYDLEVVEPARWRFTVSSGSSGNVRPRELIRAAAKEFPRINTVPLINVEREGLFVRIGDRLYQPFDGKVVGR